MSSDLILYDLPSRPHPKIHCWSGNIWKTRLVLNFKQLPYKTHWVPFHKLQATLGATDLTPYPPPNNDKSYSVPAIQFPDGSHMMDSAKLAPKLDALKPEPSLHLDLNLHQEAMAASAEFFNPAIPFFMPRVARSLCALEDVEWFRANRHARFGMSLDELDATQGGDRVWSVIQPGLDKYVEVLTRHKRDQGPFILGSVPSYGDFVLVAGLHTFMCLGREIWERIVEGRGELRELYEACGPWLERDD